MNKEVTDVINITPDIATNMFTTESSLYIYGYNVNDSGYVEIPVIGSIKVVNKTLEEAKEAIILQSLKLLKDPTVIVKLVSFKYSVLGEINRPGSYINYNNQLTILEAISQAGNVSPYSNIQRVMVIRSQENRSKTIHIDLTDRNILQSEGYFLMPNDIVYVEPMKSRNFRNNIPTYSLFLGAITAFVLILSYINPR